MGLLDAPAQRPIPMQAAQPTVARVGDLWIDAAPQIGAGASLYKTGGQGLTTATYNAILFDAKEYDDLGFHDPVSLTSRLVIPVTGRYDVHGQIEFTANTTGVRGALIFKNSTGTGTRLAQTWHNALADATVATRIQVRKEGIPLTAGEYIELAGYQTSGGNLNVTAAQTLASTFLTIRRVR